MQSDTVEHTLCCLSHTWVRIALTMQESGALYDDSAYLVERYEILKLNAITEGAGCCHHGILQVEITYINA